MMPVPSRPDRAAEPTETHVNGTTPVPKKRPGHGPVAAEPPALPAPTEPPEAALPQAPHASNGTATARLDDESADSEPHDTTLLPVLTADAPLALPPKAPPTK